MANETPYLGLYTRGPLATETYYFPDGAPAGQGYAFDLNMAILDSIIRSLQDQINAVEISGLPPVIDGGTF